MRRTLSAWLAIAFLFALIGSASAATSWNVNQNIQPGDTLTGTKNWGAWYFKNGVEGDYGRIDFYVDGVKKGQDKTRPFSYSLDTTKLANGSHTFQARAMNGSTERARETASASVDNAPPPPPPTALCADGLDNDGDGKVDLADPGCSSSTDNDETDPVSTGEPAPIAGQGYHQAFRDDFNTLNRSIWDSHIWYDDPPSSSWSGFQEVDSSGVLHLRTSRNFFWGSGSNDNWPINTMTTQTSGLTFTQGYFEARMKWTGAPGAWPAFWLFSYRHATNDSWPSVNPYCQQNGLPVAQCYSAELDVFEGQGSEPNVYYGTLHRNSCGCYGVNNSQNGNNYQPQPSNIANDWHTYSALWTATTISWYLDGRLLMSTPVYDSTNQPMYLLLQMWIGGWTTDPTSATPDVLETQVDYVTVWQK